MLKPIKRRNPFTCHGPCRRRSWTPPTPHGAWQTTRTRRMRSRCRATRCGRAGRQAPCLLSRTLSTLSAAVLSSTMRTLPRMHSAANACAPMFGTVNPGGFKRHCCPCFLLTFHTFSSQRLTAYLLCAQAPKSAYSPQADRQSWWATRSLLLTVFGLGNATNPYTSAGAPP